MEVDLGSSDLHTIFPLNEEGHHASNLAGTPLDVVVPRIEPNETITMEESRANRATTFASFSSEQQQTKVSLEGVNLDRQVEEATSLELGKRTIIEKVC